MGGPAFFKDFLREYYIQITMKDVQEKLLETGAQRYGNLGRKKLLITLAFFPDIIESKYKIHVRGVASRGLGVWQGIVTTSASTDPYAGL